MRSRSDSEPTRMPTTASGTGSDVAAELHVGEIYVRCGRIRGGTCGRNGVAESGDAEDPAAVGDEPAVSECGAGMEHERARGLGIGNAVDRRARVAALRIVARRDDHGD